MPRPKTEAISLEAAWDLYFDAPASDLHAYMHFFKSELKELRDFETVHSAHLEQLRSRLDQPERELTAWNRDVKEVTDSLARQIAAREKLLRTVRRDPRREDYENRLQAVWSILRLKSLNPRWQAKRWDQMDPEEKARLDFSRPNRKQKFTEEVQKESALQFNRYLFVDKLPAAECIAKVQEWQRLNTPDGRAASQSQIYAWRKKYGLLSPDDVSPE